MSTPTQVLAELENLELGMRPLPREERTVLYGCMGLLLFGPLAFGAVESWSGFVMEAGAAGLLMVWLWPRLKGEGAASNGSVRWNPLFAPMLAFAGLVAFQLVTGLTSYRYVTWTSALLFSGIGILCFLLTQSLRRAEEIARFGVVASLYGFGVAFFAVIQDLSANGRIYWLRLPRSGGWIYGPYVNHNHYAGLMEMLFPVALTISLSRRVERPPRIWLAVAAAFMASTIVLCGSRGGVIALVVQLGLAAAYVAFPRKSPKVAMTLGAGLVVAGLWVLLVGGTTVTERLLTFHTEAHTELSNGLRLTVTKDCARMFADRPLFGFGLGTFPTAYPPYQSFYSNIFVNEAHNDYAQLLVEMGLTGFAVMVWFLVLLFQSAWRKLKSGKLGVNGGLALAGLLGCVGILVHSFFDFNLQVASNAAWFYALAAMVAAPSVSEPRAKVSSKKREVRL